MTQTTNTSTAREVAEAIGCSIQTVMNKVKDLGIKFKGRSAAEHDILLGGLGAVRPRPRRVTAKKYSGALLRDRIVKHLNAGKRLIDETAAAIRNLNSEIKNLEGKRAGLVAYSSLLDGEQRVLAPEDEATCRDRSE